MSVIKTDLLQNRLGTSHPAVTKADFVKAWGSINTTTAPATLRVSFNCSSLTDVNPGEFNPVFTAPMAAALYAVNANVGSAPGGVAGGYSIAATHCYVNCATPAFAMLDVTGWLSFSVKGVLA